MPSLPERLPLAFRNVGGAGWLNFGQPANEFRPTGLMFS